MPCKAGGRLAGSVIEPLRISNWGKCEERNRLSLVGRRSTAVSMPRARSASRMWLPTKPEAPVRSTFNGRNSNQGQFLAHFAEFIEGEVNMLVSVGGH